MVLVICLLLLELVKTSLLLPKSYDSRTMVRAKVFFGCGVGVTQTACSEECFVVRIVASGTTKVHPVSNLSVPACRPICVDSTDPCCRTADLGAVDSPRDG